MDRIDYKEYLSSLRYIIKHNYFFIIGIMIFLMIVLVIEIMLADMSSTGMDINPAVTIIMFFINMLIQLGIVKIAVNMTNRKPYDFSMLFTPGGMLFSFIAGTIIYNLSVFIGLLMLVIPGIFIAVRLIFYPYLIVERGYTAFEALKASWGMTKKYQWQIFVIGIILYAVNFIMAITVIGLAVSLPLTLIALAQLYHHIKLRGWE
ncbi:MAG: hypothetical protein R6U31_00890 [bacterium]